MAEDRIAALEAKLADMERRLTVREDELDVKKLQYLYGYLIDKCMYNEVVDLFADDGEVRFFGGVWKGKEGVRRLYVERFQKRFTYGNNGPIDGFLLDHPQIQTIIDIDSDGKTARLRGVRPCRPDGTRTTKATNPTSRRASGGKAAFTRTPTSRAMMASGGSSA